MKDLNKTFKVKNLHLFSKLYYHLSYSNGKEGTVGREEQRLEEEGRRNEIVGGKGGGVCSKS